MKRFLFVLLALSMTTALYAQPNPSQVYIRNISFAGSGCPAGTVAANVAYDAKAFTLLFDSYVAEMGPGIPLSMGRRNCQLLLDIQYPSGWSYTVFTFDYRGYAQLDRGVQGSQQAIYYFQGSSTQVPMRSTLYGPTAQDYHYRDTLGVSSLVWSPCGVTRALNINTSVNLRGPTGSRGLMTTDSVDGEVIHQYGLQWKRCR